MPDEARVVSTSTQQSVNRKRLSALAVAVLVVVLSVQAAAAWEVQLNGETLGVVKNKDAVLALINERIAAVQADKCYDVGLASQVDFRRRFTFDRKPVEEVNQILSAGLEFGLKAAVIVVNGQEVAALATREEAEGLLEELKTRFVKNNKNATVETVRFRQDAQVTEKYRKVEDIVDRATGLNILLYGSEKLLTHTVSRGESFWSIATLYKLGVSALQAANPTIVPERLQIGAKLNLKMQEPFLVVEVVERVTYHQSIPFTTTYVTDNNLWSWENRVRTPGKPGTQAVTARVTSVNGTEEKREILSTSVVTSPTTQVVARGTKSAPTLSTGAFLWPTTGRVTSPFGPRWGGFHSGVDIGAAQGTPIKAADRGIVSFSGWNGGYGYMVRIEHGNGFATLYAHASKLLVSQNDVVEKGQTIALVGNTGNSYGPHLHFEIISNGKPLDPMTYFR